MRAFVFWLIRLTGLAWILRELVHRRCVAILCYHSPSPEVAEAHLRALKRIYNVIPLKHYIDWRTGKSSTPPPPKALVVTLDDGRKDNYRLRPVLERHKVPITIFLCSAVVGTHRHFWWTRLPQGTSSGQLEQVSDLQRLAVLSETGFDEQKDYAERQALSEEEIKELKSLVDFQSHTRFHPVLPRCEVGRATDEIATSRTELHERFGLGIYALAFPNGAYSDREVEIAKRSAYQCALTTEFGFNDARTDLFRLKRIYVLDDVSVSELLVKASGAWRPFERLLGIGSRQPYALAGDRTSVETPTRPQV